MLYRKFSIDVHKLGRKKKKKKNLVYVCVYKKFILFVMFFIFDTFKAIRDVHLFYIVYKMIRIDKKGHKRQN